MPLLLAESIQYYSRVATGVEVKKLPLSMPEEGYCTTADPRPLCCLTSGDPATEEYGDTRRFEYYTVNFALLSDVLRNCVLRSYAMKNYVQGN